MNMLCMTIKMYLNLNNLVLKNGCSFILVHNFNIHCQIFCVMTKNWTISFFQSYDDETYARG